MRIVGGTHRGRALAPLGRGDPAAHLRPTTDRVRESLFNILGAGRFGDVLTGGPVLDLFAGTGALSFEALSRGAAHATLVDSGRKAQSLIRRNAETLGLAAAITLIARDATRLGPADAPASLIFVDPPYGKGLGDRALDAARTGGWIAPGGLVVWEDSAPPPLPAWLAEADSRRFGDTWITFATAD